MLPAESNNIHLPSVSEHKETEGRLLTSWKMGSVRTLTGAGVAQAV
jgi:hypothetical protein